MGSPAYFYPWSTGGDLAHPYLAVAGVLCPLYQASGKAKFLRNHAQV